jgi:hypothetical protein
VSVPATVCRRQASAAASIPPRSCRALARCGRRQLACGTLRVPLPSRRTAVGLEECGERTSTDRQHLVDWRLELDLPRSTSQPDLPNAAWVHGVVTMDPHEPCRAEVLHDLAERADVEQPARAPEADVGLIALRLQVVDVVCVHDQAPTVLEMDQDLPVSDRHGRHTYHRRGAMGTNGRSREQAGDAAGELRPRRSGGGPPLAFLAERIAVPPPSALSAGHGAPPQVRAEARQRQKAGLDLEPADVVVDPPCRSPTRCSTGWPVSGES